MESYSTDCLIIKAYFYYSICYHSSSDSRLTSDYINIFSSICFLYSRATIASNTSYIKLQSNIQVILGSKFFPKSFKENILFFTSINAKLCLAYLCLHGNRFRKQIFYRNSLTRMSNANY